MKKTLQVSLFEKPVEFFRKLVLEASQNQNVLLQEEAEYYLVSLLTHYMKTDVMRQTGEDPLAIKLHKAMIATRIQQVQILKELGDFSLYIAGFFSDSLRRKLVDIDYYMGMGETAYHQLSTTMAQEALQGLYKDLCNRFGTYVDILAEISDQTFSHTSQDLLRLYEKWLLTKSGRLSKLLQKEGIV